MRKMGSRTFLEVYSFVVVIQSNLACSDNVNVINDKIVQVRALL